ncbi:MAG: efflux RND transporter periplasmic adaptor subunit [Candidatus Brocadiales bacterium]
MKKDSKLSIGLFIVICLTISSITSASDGQERNRKKRVRNVKAVIVKVLDVDYEIKITGTLLPENDVDVSAEIAARIKTIHFEEGDKVQEGDLLVELDDERYQLEVLENEARKKKAEADLEYAKTVEGRTRKLYQDNVISHQEYDDAATQLHVAEAALENTIATLNLTKKNLKDTRILAPISGIISEKFFDVGEYVEEADELLNIVKINPIKALFYLPERYAAEVVPGKTAKINVDAYPNEEFLGKVYFVNPKTKIETRRIACYARIDNPEGRLKPGFFINARFIAKSLKDAIIIPEEAILHEDGESFCFIVEDGVARQVYLTIGWRLKGGEVVILKGLTSENHVVIRGQYVLMDGDPVKMVDEM